MINEHTHTSESAFTTDIIHKHINNPQSQFTLNVTSIFFSNFLNNLLLFNDIK